MDEVRHDLDDIIHKTEQSRAARIEQWHRQVRNMLLGLLLLALGIGLLIGLFTRNRLHSVSAAYQTSLGCPGPPCRRDLSIGAAAAHDSRLHRRRRHHLRCRWTRADDESGRQGADRMDPVLRPAGNPLEEVFHIVNEISREPVETPVAKVKRLNHIVGMANHTIAHPQRRNRTAHRRQRRADPQQAGRDASASSWSFATSRWSARPRTLCSPTKSSRWRGGSRRRSRTRSTTRSTPSPICSTSCAHGATAEESVQFMDMAEQRTGSRHPDQPCHAGTLSRIHAPRSSVDLKEMHAGDPSTDGAGA